MSKKILPPIYEGKASNLYEVEGEPNILIIERKDDITAGNGERHDVIPGKGVLCNKISQILFDVIQRKTPSVIVHNHYCNPEAYDIELSDRETLVNRFKPIKLEVVVRNIATGSLIKRLPFDEGQKLDPPIVSLYYKDDALGDPLINETEAVALGLLLKEEDEDADEYRNTYVDIKHFALEINEALYECFERCDITLVDFKIEFGLDEYESPILIDEISPDTCRLRDAKTGASLDKDLYRNGESLETVLAAYEDVYHRLLLLSDEEEENEEDDDYEEDDEEDDEGDE